MRRLLVRGLTANARRTFTTALAVVLGVALIAGTLVLTDTIGRSFDQITGAQFVGVDAAVTPRESAGPKSLDSADQRQLPRRTLDRVRRVLGVRDASGQVQGQDLAVFHKDGRERVGGAFAPGIVTSVAPSWVGSLHYRTGRPPVTSGEVALDRDAAAKGGFTVGDPVPVQGVGPQRRLRLSGTVVLGSGGQSFGGATVAIVTEDTAAVLAGRTAKAYYGQIAIRARPGVSPERLVASLRRDLGRGVSVRTGHDEAARQAASIKQNLSFLPTLLFVFAGIATFVGAFLIFNTFSITVAQRQREHALLRALGAGRGQIRRQVLGEAVAVGLLGSVLGVAAGLVVAPALRALLASVGADLPTTATVFAPRTVLVGLLVGLGVTLAAGLVPAARATRVAPIEALRDAAAPPAAGRVRRAGVVAGALVGVLGLVVGALGVTGAIDGDGASIAAGVGAGLLFLAAILLAPLLVAPLAFVLGAPLRRLFGLPGRLARDNAVRQPGRTAVTASALMIGLALVVFATVFASGLRSTLRGDLERSVAAPLVVEQGDRGATRLPDTLLGALRRNPAVRTAGAVSFVQVRVGGHDRSVNVADGVLLDRGLLRLRTPGGRVLGDPGAGGAYVAVDVADELGVRRGSRLRATGTNGRTVSLRVAGVVEKAGFTLGPISIDTRTARTLGTVRPALVAVDARGGPTALRSTLAHGYPGTKALTSSDWIGEQTGQVDQLVTLVYVLLLLSVLVALFGIVNTLSLSVTERIRELGLLRAVGASRRQVRRMVTLEAVITSVLGALLGVVLGFVLATAVGATLDGFVLTVPILPIVGLILLAAGAGVVAAILPARRAARVDLLAAIAEE